MIEFDKFAFNPEPEWKFMEFKSIIIGQHKINGAKLQLSSAYNHPTFYFNTHKEGLFIIDQFASVKEEDNLQLEILLDNDCKVGCIDIIKNNKNETYFYTMKSGNATVSVLQNGKSTKEEKDLIASMLSTIQYKTTKKVTNENA